MNWHGGTGRFGEWSRKQIAVGTEDVFGPVAMLDIEFHHGDALQAVDFPPMHGNHGDIVEQAEPHALGRLGMMTGRTAQNELLASPTITASTAAQTDPAARSAASSEPGEITVPVMSASIRPSSSTDARISDM